jgi:hypothetical protein
LSKKNRPKQKTKQKNHKMTTGDAPPQKNGPEAAGPSGNQQAKPKRSPVERFLMWSGAINKKVAAELFLGTVVAAATAVNVCVAIYQWSAMVRANNIAAKALSGVERPVLLASVPDEFIVASGPTGPRPIINFHIENAGKQPAIVYVTNASLTVQDGTTPPPPLIAYQGPNDGSVCFIYPIGQPVIKSTTPTDITCRRETRFSTVEADSIIRNAKFAFLRLNLLYFDPLNYRRATELTYLWRPIDRGNVRGRFVQIDIEEKQEGELTSKDKEARQRGFIDVILQIERENESRPP